MSGLFSGQSEYDADLDVRIPFGRYQGHRIGAVLKSDPLWIRWALANIPIRSDTFRAALNRVALAHKHTLDRAEASAAALR